VDVLFHQPVEIPETATAHEAAAELRATVHNGLERIYRGEMDQPSAPGDLRTEDAPGRSHLPSPPDAPQSQGQSTA
jgi:1-acyl-sn-glycerol-3-phosphate acyltransferase